MPFPFILYGVIIFSFDLFGIGLQTSFPAFLSMRLSQSYVHGYRICELTWFN
jgi:hypothetical protein